ncbi:hypothetical protein EJ08DRAFT_457947 [Tothia fuscella]|uniref:WW-domain-binding protein n=1 Tax=Tothia fuscella TaxID=1048955 RepID=A0A9P4NIJ4_9PEZI|nr:hypothetical protein EJ08DRAFT_457947 [Tothia fuscella]
MLKLVRKCSWVMLSESEGFTPLPGEQRLYTSPPRTTLSLQSLNKYPGKQPYTVQSSAGSVFLTNRRIVYLPQTSTPTLQSFAAPILHLHDSHVAAPFFGPNVWTAIVQPVPGGNIPPEHAALELKMTFKDGGAFDFHTSFERIKERLQQAVDVARESGQLVGDGTETRGGAGGGTLSGLNLDLVNLDELPAYEDATRAAGISTDATTSPPAQQPLVNLDDTPSSTMPSTSRGQRDSRDEVFTPPEEPPPGYESVQNQSVGEELERRMRSPST